MDRRIVGALLLIAVLAAAITVPFAGGVRTAGAPTMMDFPADPRVGDCLLQPIDSAGAESAAAGGPEPVSGPKGRTAFGATTVGELTAMFGPCDSVRLAGEVVAVRTITGADRSRRQQAQESNLDCRAASLEHAGLVPSQGRFEMAAQRGDDPVAWGLSANVTSRWILPSPLLQSAGRIWAACVVTAPTGQPYQGRVADAFNGGRLPDQFGTCWNSVTVSSEIRTVDCRSPHLAELISAGIIDYQTEVTDAQLKASCANLVGLVLDRSTSSMDGLTVRTSPERLPENLDRTLSVLCYVTPTQNRELDASLVGIRDDPIPYAG